MSLNFKNIQAGARVEIGYRCHKWNSKFLGFTSNDEKYSEKPVYPNAKALFEATGAHSFHELEQIENNVAPEYGHGFYAVFEDDDADRTVWSAYLFHGGWAIGSSADRAKIYGFAPIDAIEV